MKNDIIMIIDSILDDYYLLWECFSEFKQNTDYDNVLLRFSSSLKEAYKLNYFDFFEGDKFNGDEILISNFILNDIEIQKLLDWNSDLTPEIRVKTSNKGIEFLKEIENEQGSILN